MSTARGACRFAALPVRERDVMVPASRVPALLEYSAFPANDLTVAADDFAVKTPDAA